MAAYARQAVTRDAAGWTVSGNSATLAAIATFPTMASGAGGTVTYFGVGTASSGAGNLLFFGTVTPNIAVTAGVAPKLDTATAISNTTPDGMTNAAATNFLNHLFANTDWANIGDATGLVQSTSDGNFYLSLHTSSPGESGDQTTNEISYS